MYLPIESTHRVTVDLRGTAGSLSVEWFDPATGRHQIADPIEGGHSRTFDSPFDEPGLLHIRAIPAEDGAAVATAP